MNGVFAVIFLTASALLQVAGEPASISIQTEPGAQISWEGRPVAEAAADGTVSLSGMPYGRYSVVLSRPGFQTRRVTVQARPGTQRLHLPLQPDTPGPPPVNTAGSESAATETPAPPPTQPVSASQPPAPDPPAHSPTPSTAEEPPGEPPEQPDPSGERPGATAVDREPEPPPAQQDRDPAGVEAGVEVPSADRWWWVVPGVLLLAWLAWVLAGRMAPDASRQKPARDPESLEAFTRTLSPPGSRAGPTRRWASAARGTPFRNESGVRGVPRLPNQRPERTVPNALTLTA